MNNEHINARPDENPEPAPGADAQPDWLPLLVAVKPVALAANEALGGDPPPSAPAGAALDGARSKYRPSGHYRANNLPAHLHPDNWPPFDPAPLSRECREGQAESDFDRHRRFYEGIIDYCKNGVLKSAAEIARTSSPELLRVFNRCLWQDQSGQIWGFAATLKGASSGNYERSSPVASGSGPTGTAGAFRHFLETHPEVLRCMVEAIDPPRGKRLLSRGSFNVVYTAFRKACLAESIGEHDYPLSSDSGANRSVRRFIDAYLDGHPGAIEYWFGVAARDHLPVGRLGEYFELSQHPYGECMIDAHRVDVQSTIVIDTPNGPKPVAISRVWLVVCACTNAASDAVVGFSWSYEEKPSAETIERAVLCAQTPWKPRALCAGLAYAPGAGLPNGMVDGLEGAPIVLLKMDNESGNWGRVNQQDLRRALGCHLVYGPVRKWFTNARLERIFRALNQAGIHVLPSTTGSGPQDKLRPSNAGQAAVQAPLDFTFVHDLIEVIVTGMNAEKRATLSDESPLENIRNRMTLGAHRWLPRPIAPPSPFAPRLGWVEEWRRIAGDRARGVRPYFELHGRRYSSPDIESNWDLVGRPILRRVRRADSFVEAFFEDGRALRDIGVLGRKRDVPMPLSVKAALYNSKNRQRERFIDLEQALRQRMHELATQAAKDAQKRPHKISKAATQLAQIYVLYAESGLEVPQRQTFASSNSARAATTAVPAAAGRAIASVTAHGAKAGAVIPLRPQGHFALMNKKVRR